MKKVLFFSVLISIMVLGGFIFLKPSASKGIKIIGLSVPYPLALRSFSDTSQWHIWQSGVDSLIAPNHITFAGAADAQVGFYFHEKKDSVLVIVRIFPAGNDSIYAIWSIERDSTLGIIDNWKAASMENRLEMGINSILRTYGEHYGNPQNVYGLMPGLKKVEDTMYIMANASLNKYPDTRDIYGLIDKLKTYAKQQGTNTSGFPIYHVEELKPGFTLRVAIPIQKEIGENEWVSIKKMVPGKLLVAEVTAGPESLPRLFKKFEQYKSDRSLVSPAIPFFQPITERHLNSDTSQWVTRLCYPIF